MSGVAHCPQKANPGGLAKPHVGHGPVSGVAHWPQNFIPGEFSNPQLGQRIGPFHGDAHAPEPDVVGVIDSACGTMGKRPPVSTLDPTTSQGKFRERAGVT